MENLTPDEMLKLAEITENWVYSPITGMIPAGIPRYKGKVDDLEIILKENQSPISFLLSYSIIVEKQGITLGEFYSTSPLIRKNPELGARLIKLYDNIPLKIREKGLSEARSKLK